MFWFNFLSFYYTSPLLILLYLQLFWLYFGFFDSIAVMDIGVKYNHNWLDFGTSDYVSAFWFSFAPFYHTLTLLTVHHKFPAFVTCLFLHFLLLPCLFRMFVLLFVFSICFWFCNFCFCMFVLPFVFSLCFWWFLGFLGSCSKSFIRFSTAISMHILKLSLVLFLGVFWTEILTKERTERKLRTKMFHHEILN